MDYAEENIVIGSLNGTLKQSAYIVPEGLLGSAVHLPKSAAHLDYGLQTEDSCLRNLSKCAEGVSVSLWLNFEDMAYDTYIMRNGNSQCRYFFLLNKVASE